MRITIVGGGNIGTQFAVHCAEKGHKVVIYTSKPDLYDGHLNIVDEKGVTTHEGDIESVTADPEIAFRHVELILVTVPATMMKSIAEKVYASANEKTIIGVVPGNGGNECAFKKCIDRGNVFFGIERVPAIARLVQKGKTVMSTGYKPELHVAALPRNSTKECADLIHSLFDMKTTVIPNFLNLTMTPSNPILHTTRLYTIFHDWHEGVVYPSLPLFYEEWDDKSSELLITCDDELQRVCQALPEFELSYVKPLKVYYESPSIEAMTKKLSSITAFKGLKTPTVNVEGGLIPDLHSRYFTADFSYGLSIIKQIAELAEVSTPSIDRVIGWYKGIAIEKGEFKYSDYGIDSLDDLRAFYLR